MRWSRVTSNRFGQRFSQIKTAAIRIKMRVLDRLPHRCERLWRRPERIFIGGELDDIVRLGAELARRFLDRFARLDRP